MNNNEKSLPDSELKVMKIIWDSTEEKMSTGEIFDKLGDTSWKLSTLQIILARLIEKNFLKSEKIGRFNYYSSLVDGENYQKTETRNFVKKMFNNSSKKLIVALLEDDEDLTDEDISEIKKMLNKGGEI